MSHKKIPAVSKANISSEMSFVCLDLYVFITCGKKDIVVSVPAANPSRVAKSIHHIVLVGLYVFTDTCVGTAAIHEGQEPI